MTSGETHFGGPVSIYGRVSISEPGTWDLKHIQQFCHVTTGLCQADQGRNEVRGKT